MYSMKPSADTHPTYVIKQLEKTSAPENGRGSDWYRYVIEGARSQIVGYTHGTLVQVMQNVQEFASKINERTEGRSIYPWTPRQAWRHEERKT